MPLSESGLIERFFRSCGAQRRRRRAGHRRRRGAAGVPGRARSWSRPPTRWSRGCTFPHGSPRAVHRPSCAGRESERSCGDGRTTGLGAAGADVAAGRRGVARGVRRRALGAWRASTMWPWSAATPRAARCASPCSCSGIVPRGGRADARAAADRGTRCSSPERRAMPARAWRSNRAVSARLPRPRATCASASCCPRRASRSGSGCAGWRAPASTCPTACWADAGKLAAASGAGLEIWYEALPVSAPLHADRSGRMRARELALTAGDDYELCFARAPAERRGARARAAPAALELSSDRSAAAGGGRGP